MIVLGDATPGPGVPQLSCLERTVCCAIAQAYPERAHHVQRWLEQVGQSHTLAESAKAYSWSYMAAWFPGFGCDGFFQEIWRDPLIHERLLALLEESGAWKMIEQTVKGYV